jgi:hypothetical protein
MTHPSLLSPEQAAFAAAHEFSDHMPVASPEGGVYVYRVDGGCSTERWLVARDGTELDWERLR